MKIGSKTTLEELAAVICMAMQERGVQAVLVGGAVVSIWSNNAYQSRDLDFITTATHKVTNEVMARLGFRKGRGRHYTHAKTAWFVEFPTGPLAIGEERITRWARRKSSAGTIQLLGPTECVMDRLAAYFHWKDSQALEQAVLVAKVQPINRRRIAAWAAREGAAERYEDFRAAMKRP